MLAEIAPPHIRGRVGVLNQVGIVVGILLTQGVGMNYALPREWRHVLSFSASLGVIQLLVGFLMEDSPVWYKCRGKNEEAVRIAKRLWKEEPIATDIENLSLNADEFVNAQETEMMIEPLQSAESVVDVIMTMEYRKPLGIVALIMIAQQLSGQYFVIGIVICC